MAASLPVVEKEKESAHALPPVAEVDTEEEEEEEEKKVVVLSEAPVPWPSQAEAEELAPSKAGRTSDDASMESAASEWSGRRRRGRWRTCPTRRGG